MKNKLEEMMANLPPLPYVVRGTKQLSWLAGTLPDGSDTMSLATIRTGSDSTEPLAHYLARAANNLPLLVETLDGVVSALENCLLHSGKPMSAADLAGRRELAAEARRVLGQQPRAA